jgi:hypothetical protein
MLHVVEPEHGQAVAHNGVVVAAIEMQRVDIDE